MKLSILHNAIGYGSEGQLKVTLVQLTVADKIHYHVKYSSKADQQSSSH